MKTLPNKLTAARLVMVALFPLGYFLIAPWVGLALYALAGITDFLDGYLARKYESVTVFGQVMDPLADKLMLSVTLICLAASGRVAWWFAILVTAKEMVMIVAGIIMYSRMDKLVQPAALIGKAATVIFIAGVALSFFDPIPVFGLPLSWGLLLVGLVLTLLAFLKYAVMLVRRLADNARQARVRQTP